MFAAVGFSEALISSFGQNSGELTKNGAGDVDVKYDIINGLFIWETARLLGPEVCRDRRFAGAGRLPGRDVYRSGTLNRILPRMYLTNRLHFSVCVCTVIDNRWRHSV